MAYAHFWKLYDEQAPLSKLPVDKTAAPPARTTEPEPWALPPASTPLDKITEHAAASTRTDADVYAPWEPPPRYPFVAASDVELHVLHMNADGSVMIRSVAALTGTGARASVTSQDRVDALWLQDVRSEMSHMAHSGRT